MPGACEVRRLPACGIEYRLANLPVYKQLSDDVLDQEFDIDQRPIRKTSDNGKKKSVIFIERRDNGDILGTSRYIQNYRWSRKMNTLLWAIQVILGIKLLTVSYTHGLRQSKTEMHEAIQKMGLSIRPLLFLIAACTFMGTLGIILPGILHSSPWVTPLSAVGSALLLLVSLYFHLRSREKPKIFVSIILFVFAAFVAYGRWVLAPF